MTIKSFSPTVYELVTLLGVGIMLAIVIFAAGLFFGLTLKTGLGHLVAGLILKIVKPFQLGDTISLAGSSGTVESVRWFSTVLVMPDNATINVPNIKLMESTIVNQTAKGTRKIEIMFGIEYGQDIDAAQDIIEEVLSKDPRIHADPCPRVAVSKYFSCGVVLVAQAWVSTSGYRQARSEITASVQNLLIAEDVHMLCIGNAPTDAVMKHEPIMPAP